MRVLNTDYFSILKQIIPIDEKIVKKRLFRILEN